MDKDSTEPSYDAFTLEPYGNITIGISPSPKQKLYVDRARNLVLRNFVLVKINGSRPFTLYRLEDNTTVKLAERTMFYSLNLSGMEIEARLVMENEADATMNVKIDIKRVLTVKTADFTIPHAGFIIFIVTLTALQFLFVGVNGDTVIGSVLNRIAFKLCRKSIDVQKIFPKANATYGFIIEIFVPMLLWMLSCAGIYVSMIRGQDLSLIENFKGSVFDCAMRLVLILTSFCYFFTVIVRVLSIVFQIGEVWILERRGRNFLETYEELHKAEAERTTLIIVLSAFILLVIAIMMIDYFKLGLWIVSGTMLCLLSIVYAIVYHVRIKRLQEHIQSRLGCDSFKENLAGFMEIDAKIMGFWVIGIVVISATFIGTSGLFSALTINMLLLEFYPSFIYSFIYEFGQSSVSWVNAFGQFQALLYLILIGPYWITRVMICRFKAEYKSKLLRDIVIFLVVFFVSEYFRWSYSFFIQNQPYDLAGLLNSIPIGLTASILNDLLTELFGAPSHLTEPRS